jgi:hypothetical protein
MLRKKDFNWIRAKKYFRNSFRSILFKINFYSWLVFKQNFGLKINEIYENMFKGKDNIIYFFYKAIEFLYKAIDFLFGLKINF